MSHPQANRMIERLRELQGTSPDIEASAVVSVDGLIIASALPSEISEDRVSAMSAAILGLGEHITGEFARGELEQVIVRGTGGFVLLTAIGDEAVLTALASEKSKLGLVSLDLRRTADHLLELFE